MCILWFTYLLCHVKQHDGRGQISLALCYMEITNEPLQLGCNFCCENRT